MSETAAAPPPPTTTGSWLPTRALIATKFLEQRKRIGLMVVVGLLTVGLPFLVLGIRLLFHAFDPSSYGPAGTPDVFVVLSDTMAEFGFIAAAVLGASAGTTDLADGVFRHLVITGRSRLALYFARIPAGLGILVPLVAVAFAGLCLVTSFAAQSAASTIQLAGVSIPAHLSEAQLETWLLDHPAVVKEVLPVGLATGTTDIRSLVHHDIGTIDSLYEANQPTLVYPAGSEMAKIGLWIELDILIGFLVGLGFGALTGQRTVVTVAMIVLQIIVTPILTQVTIPYFINGQRLVVGVAFDQLRPAYLSTVGTGHRGRAIIGGRTLGIPPMPTWAMVAIIVAWLVGWTAIGAWQMARRDT